MSTGAYPSIKSSLGITLAICSVLRFDVVAATNYYKSQQGLVCFPCPPGQKVKTDCTFKYGKPVCIFCEPGYYNSQYDGSKYCASCLMSRFNTENCPKGSEVITNCTIYHKFICQCKTGRYYHTFDEYCKKHSTCGPGEQEKFPGNKTADVTCERCPKGFYSNRGTIELLLKKKCLRHTNCSKQGQHLTKPGTAKKDSTCSENGTQVPSEIHTAQNVTTKHDRPTIAATDVSPTNHAATDVSPTNYAATNMSPTNHIEITNAMKPTFRTIILAVKCRKSIGKKVGWDMANRHTDRSSYPSDETFDSVSSTDDQTSGNIAMFCRQRSTDVSSKRGHSSKDERRFNWETTLGVGDEPGGGTREVHFHHDAVQELFVYVANSLKHKEWTKLIRNLPGRGINEVKLDHIKHDNKDYGLEEVIIKALYSWKELNETANVIESVAKAFRTSGFSKQAQDIEDNFISM